MSGYWEGSKSWCSATPTVRISANTSKPSNVQPRFAAISAFHCDRLSERYHGDVSKVPTSLMIPSVILARHALPADREMKAYANIPRAWKSGLCRQARWSHFPEFKVSEARVRRTVRPYAPGRRRG